jgi:hypothetical protein
MQCMAIFSKGKYIFYNILVNLITSGREKNSFMPQGKFKLKNCFEIQIEVFEFWKKNDHTTRGKWKKSILKFETNWPYHQREIKKFEICHEKLKLKKWKF